MRILLATGGSGGHVIPAIRVANYLRTFDHHVVIAGTFRRSEHLLQKHSLDYFSFPSSGFPGKKIFLFIPWLLEMIKGFLIMRRFIQKGKYDVVCGFGSFASVPSVLAGRSLGVDTLIHEQNFTPGKANQFLSGYANKICVTFPQTKDFFKHENISVTGCPLNISEKVKGSQQHIRHTFGLKEGFKTILVVGGSQGSQAINEMWLKVIPTLKESIPFQVIHVTGSENNDILIDAYNKFGIPFAIFSFLDNIEDAYKVVDIVITRGGALSLLEIAHFDCPAIIIPYPYAQRHQKANAQIFIESGQAIVLEENQLEPERLKQQLKIFLSKDKASFPKNNREKIFAVKDPLRSLAHEITVTAA